jgi:hypothetical protein
MLITARHAKIANAPCATNPAQPASTRQEQTTR